MENPLSAYLGKFRHVLLLLVIGLSLLANAFVPTGGMLETDESGRVRITICSGQGTQSAWVNTSTGQIDRSDLGDFDKDAPIPTPQPCPFMMASADMDSIAVPPLQSLVIIAEPYLVHAKPSLVFVGQSPLRNFARGPPISI